MNGRDLAYWVTAAAIVLLGAAVLVGIYSTTEGEES